MNKTDKRADIRRKKKYKRVHHGIGAWSPDFIHLMKKRNGKTKPKYKIKES